MDYSKYKFLLIKVQEGIAFITFNRPEKLNAANREMHKEFATIFRDVARDSDVRVAVITGAGRAFQVGGDFELLEDMANHPEVLDEWVNEIREVVYAHIDLEKPVIAAVNGHAMGGGLAIALLSDFVIVERQAKLADGHMRAAFAAGDGGALIWPMTVGLTKAKRYLLTGDWITAEEAERIGLITEVVEKGQSLKRATEIAKRLAAGPQVAIRFTKRALNQWLRLGGLSVFDYSCALEVICQALPGMKEAMRNMKAKGPGAMPPE